MAADQALVVAYDDVPLSPARPPSFLRAAPVKLARMEAFLP